jgi:hypothetical protein
MAASVVAFFGVFGLAIYVGQLGLNKVAFWALMIPAAWALAVICQKMVDLHCPRCGWNFYPPGMNRLGRKIFLRKCINCGLRKWQRDGVS